MYDANKKLVPVFFFHFVVTESEETWTHIFEAALCIDGYDRAGRVTIVDQKKSIEKAYRK